MNAPVSPAAPVLSGSVQKRIEVIACDVKTYKGKDGRPDGQYQVLQCIVRGYKDGTPTVEVGTMRVFGEMAKEPVKTGEYFAEFDIAVGWRGDDKGEIGARLIGLKPAQPQDAKPGMQSPVQTVKA
jgi:hypothetical protein